MIDASQVILDITAIGISVYTLIRMYDIQSHVTWNVQETERLKLDAKRIEELVPKEIYANGLEPGIYLPKESKDKDDAVDMVKAMELSEWTNLVKKG